jgi:hypothetical protein
MTNQIDGDKLGWWAALAQGPAGATQLGPRARIFEVRP